MIRSIFIDVGDVLVKVNFEKLIISLASNSDSNEAEIASYIYESKLVKQYREGDISTDNFLHKLKSDINYHGTYMDLAERWDDIFEPIIENIHLMEKLTNTYKVILASNTNPLHAQKVLSLIGDVKFYNSKIFSFEIGISKPDPKFFEYALKLSNAIAMESIFIDDIEENVIAARRLGFISKKIDHYSDLRRELIELGIII